MTSSFAYFPRKYAAFPVVGAALAVLPSMLARRAGERPDLAGCAERALGNAG